MFFEWSRFWDLSPSDSLILAGHRMSHHKRHISTIGYTVPFTLVHAGKYRTEDKSKMQRIRKLNTTRESKQCKTQQNPGLVAFYDTRPGNEVGLFYNAPESWAHTGPAACQHSTQLQTDIPTTNFCHFYYPWITSRHVSVESFMKLAWKRHQLIFIGHNRFINYWQWWLCHNQLFTIFTQVC